jgi:type I restriction-modification system DNA methylase subunit
VRQVKLGAKPLHQAAIKQNDKEEPLETTLWKAADKLTKNMDAAEYKHVVLWG